KNGDDAVPGVADRFVHSCSPAPIGCPGSPAPAPKPEAFTIGPACTGRLAVWEINKTNPMIIQFASSEEPPAAINGVVKPVSGTTRNTPPTTTKTCTAIAPPSPPASS